MLDEVDKGINNKEDGNENCEGAQFVCDGDSVITNHGVSTTCTSEVLGSIHPPYGSIIADCITNIIGITNPKDWQLLLIQSVLFNTNTNKLRALCIRRMGNGKSLPIQCAATTRRYVTIVIVPLLSVGID